MPTQLKKTVKPSGGDYTTLEDCMHANEQNLVAADKYFDVEIDGNWSAADTKAVTIHNYTTDATHYINIYTTAAARHKGVWNSSYYQLIISSNSIGSIKNLVDFVTINGLQCKGIETNHYAIPVIYSTNTCTVKNCIVTGLVTYQQMGISFELVSGKTFTAYNNIIYNIGTVYAGIYFGRGTCYIYNNTVYGCAGIGIKMVQYETGYYVKNNICYNNVTDYAGFTAGTNSNNLSKDATAPGTAAQPNSTLTFVNTSIGSEDFHLVSTDTDAIGNGTDLSTTFTDDINGITRTIPWDIGAAKYISVPPANPYPKSWLKKKLISGYHSFVNAYLKAKVGGYTPLKLPDGTVF